MRYCLDEVNVPGIRGNDKRQLSVHLSNPNWPQLWHRKIQRHAITARRLRIKVSTVVGTESDTALHDPRIMRTLAPK